jgi:hypothetical protein
MHTGLATDEQGKVLGLVYNQVWARAPEQFNKARRRKQLPIEDKESYRWLQCIDDVCAQRDEHSVRTQLLHIGDREEDIHEVLEKITAGNDACVIRSNQDRKVAGEHGRLRPTLAAQPVLERGKIEVPRTKGQRKRWAKVEVRSVRVTLIPSAAYPSRQPVTINAVRVREVDPPEGVKPLDWLLFTTLGVTTAKQCRRVIDIYKLRWLIEDFHLVLKSGCRIEDTQLKTAERIEELLAVLCVVAALILQLRQWSRLEPAAPCTVALNQDEWRVLLAHTQNEPIPAGRAPPTIAHAVRLIGRLGGHLGRKSDGMPGVRTLWKGWRDLQILVAGYRAGLYLGQAET